MEHYKSRHNDFFHFTNPHDDASDFDDDDYDELQYYDVDDDRSCDFDFHTLHPIGVTQSPPPSFQTSGVRNQNDDVEEFWTFNGGALILQLDNTMKKFSDKFQQTIVGIGAQISHLEDETCKLGKRVENVKNSENTYHGMTHRKLRQMQSILEEVQDDVLFLRDKYEIAEMQLQLATLQRLKRDKTTPMNPQQHVQLPAPQSSSHTPFAAHQASPKTPEFTAPKYLIPPKQTPHQNQPDHSFPSFTQSYQPISFQGVGNPQNHPFFSHHSQETPNNRPSYTYSSSQEHVLPPRNLNYMPKFASYSDIHPHEISNMIPVECSLNSQEQNSITISNTDTPVAQPPPHALPIAIDVDERSSSEENDNTKDIVDKATAMGFRRDHVRACLIKMAQNGSPVNLNSVLDKMMNNK